MGGWYRQVVVVALLVLVYPSRCERESRNANCPIISMSSESENSESIEMPIRKQRSDQSQHRPIVELVLGMLDTFHSSSKSDLKRLRARRARENDANQTAIIKTTEEPILSNFHVTKAHQKKRFTTLKS